eukprot:c21779_g2_i2.p1 GENE.c21779_g2_i2~~c21779_g2_i2.p1  ORF type:complete len:499 (-),score=154.52 c21779_g2_i2:839-2335(-)
MQSLMEEMLLRSISDPITGEIMLDAVNTPTGHVFSRRVILKCLEEKQENPLTRAKLEEKDLTPNLHIRQCAEEYQKMKEKEENDYIDELKLKLLQEWDSENDLIEIEKIEKLKLQEHIISAYNTEKQKSGGEEMEMQYHGTTVESISGIRTTGFKIPTSSLRVGDKEGNLRFGLGIYTTESLKKATTYGDKTIVICRIIVRNVMELSESHEMLTPNEVHNKGYESVFCNFRGNEPSERAFYSPNLLLPEYIVHFKLVGKDNLDLPEQMPSTDIPVLVQFLRSTEQHKSLALKYLADCFRDNQAESMIILKSLRAEYYSAITNALEGTNEQLILLALRALWNGSFGHRQSQYDILVYIKPTLIIGYISSHTESIQYRTLGVLVNLCHLEVENHKKIVSAEPDLGNIFINKTISALRKNNDDLAFKFLSCLANIASTGVLKLHHRTLDRVVEKLIFSPEKPVSEKVTQAAYHLCSNIISEGKVDQEWLTQGFQPRVGQRE